MTSIAVCNYGAGNTRSVSSALGRTGATVTLTGDAAFLEQADLAVLPGVGAARSAMEALRRTGQDQALRNRVRAGRPVLGICLGLQLALQRSDEDGGVEGLAILPGRVTRLTQGPVPRLGWGLVEPWNEAYYFAHSYAADTTAAVATSDGVVAAAATGSFLGVQFHPEKSGPAGERFLARYVASLATAAGVA